ncbi:Cof-type HAD-IIB family hydrolase [Bacillus tianshenii]|nr:Cof-type HAD-IIB family hydrolase [Bacillus tianshenii]
MVQCIALDMDGTLVNSNLIIHEENAKAIEYARNRGIEVVVATGRSYPEAKDVLYNAGIHCPIICVNGSEIRDSEGRIIEKVGLERDTFQKIRTRLEGSELYYEVYTDQGTFTNDYEKALAVMIDVYLSAGDTKDYEQLLQGAKARFEHGLITHVEHYDELLQKEDLTIYKVLAFSFDQEKLKRAKEEVMFINGLAVSASAKENIEITSKHAQKGIALEKFTAARGLSLKETMAVGDNYNDVSMLEAVGHSVAMGNAPDDIKELCDMVTTKNDEHGVAQAIHHVLKNQKEKRGI